MQLKSPEHRVRETTTLKEKLDALGLPLDDPDVRRLYDELERYDVIHSRFHARYVLG
jgi:hypothetical protein